MSLLAIDLTQVDTVKQHELGFRYRAPNGKEYIYVAGVASNVEGQVISFDEDHASLLIAGNAVGRVGVSMAAVVASSFGWVQIYGKNTRVLCAAAVAADKALYIASGNVVDDATVSGDKVNGMFSRSAQSGSPARLTAELNYPYVDDASSVGA